jgi:hypothetical protein
VFYAKTQTGLETDIQNVLDLAVMINSDTFGEDNLFKKAIQYNIIPEAIFCLNLYNRIFTSGKQIDLSLYIEKLNEIRYKIKWKPLLMASLDMRIDDLMIGDFHKEFPKLQRAVERSQAIPYYWIDWFIQGFIIGSSIESLLK